MRTARFALPLFALLIAALWLIFRIVTQSSPEALTNVVAVLVLLFIAATAAIALLSWLLGQYLRGSMSEGMALRHGLWAGLFTVLLPLLRWGSLLSPLMIAALLLALISAEAMLMLRTEPPRPTPRRAPRRSK